MLYQCLENWHSNEKKSLVYDPMGVLGKIKYQPPGFSLSNIGVIYPYDWRYYIEECSARGGPFKSDQCKAKLHNLDKALTITYWTHGW